MTYLDQKRMMYQNGNVQVQIFPDGTKIREYPDTETPAPIHPESMDVKITDWCDGGCAWCHEKSTIAGQHADLNRLLQVLEPMQPGTEIAIGGGQPLIHPGLVPFLRELNKRGIIANVTVNEKHVASNQELLLALIKEDLVKGIGISFSDGKYLDSIEPIVQASPNVVFHLIAGINYPLDIDRLYDFCAQNKRQCKVLILGYKDFGRGIMYRQHNTTVERNKYAWYTGLTTYFKRSGLVLSFDNLAINQLNLKRFFKDDAWSRFYMGDDGQFTMYCDAVKQQFARSSTSPDRVGWDVGLINYFATLR